MLRKAILFCAAALTACGNAEPSQEDMQGAMLRYMMGPESKILDSEHIKLEAASDDGQFVSTKKIACKASESNPGYACDMVVQTCVSESADGCKPREVATNGRFVKGDDGWQYRPDNPMTAIGRPIEILRQIQMSSSLASGGAAGCFPKTLSAKDQERALRMGGEMCR